MCGLRSIHCCLAFLVFSFGSCGRDVPKPPPPVPNVDKPVVRPKESALIRQCKALTGWRVRRPSARDKEPVDIVMPPPITDKSVDSATRRLAALRAIDLLEEQLKLAPRNPHLHFAIGSIHQYSFENRTGAERHFCGAVLADRFNDKYREMLLSVWLSPGMEPHLVGSLEVGQRHLPWRTIRQSVLSWEGVDDRERARAFTDAIHAMARIAKTRSFRTERVRWTLSNATSVLNEWVLDDRKAKPEDMLAAVVVRKSQSKRFDFLKNRGSPTVPAGVWMVSDANENGVVYARGPKSFETLWSLIHKHIPRQTITLSLTCGRRSLVIVGQLNESSLRVSRIAAKPDAVSIRRAVDG